MYIWRYLYQWRRQIWLPAPIIISAIILRSRIRPCGKTESIPNEPTRNVTIVYVWGPLYATGVRGGFVYATAPYSHIDPEQ
jgi:hypothetical protein